MADAAKSQVPIHPAFTHFPIALWTTGVAFDVVSFWLGNLFVHAAFYVMVAGCLMAIPAAIAGLIDYARLEDGAPVKQEGVVHALSMAAITFYFFANTVVRGHLLYARHASVPVFVFAVIGLIVLFVAAWLGHRLVFRDGAFVSATKPPVAGAPLRLTPPVRVQS